jgi:hypothetical protein
LLAESLVVLEPNRGFRVSGLSREDLYDVAIARIAVETTALRLAIRDGDDRWEAGVVGAMSDRDSRDLPGHALSRARATGSAATAPQREHCRMYRSPVTALSSDFLAANNIKTLQDLAAAVPGFVTTNLDLRPASRSSRAIRGATAAPWGASGRPLKSTQERVAFDIAMR